MKKTNYNSARRFQQSAAFENCTIPKEKPVVYTSYEEFMAAMDKWEKEEKEKNSSKVS